jgi:hypothetical protein
MAGFYKLQDDILIRAGCFVHSADYSLLVENKDTYEYPVDGWYWFDSFDEAVEFLQPPVDFIFLE